MGDPVASGATYACAAGLLKQEFSFSSGAFWQVTEVVKVIIL